MTKQKILFLTPLAFHPNAANAGARTVNFYCSSLSRREDLEVAIAYTGDKDKDFGQMVASFESLRIYNAFEHKSILQKGYDYFRYKYWYPFLKTRIPQYYITDGFTKNRIRKCLQQVKDSGFVPDVVIVEFPRLIFWIGEIRQILPAAYMVASCHDVSFLSVQRYMGQLSSGKFKGDVFYKKFKSLEISVLSQFDLAVVLNEKDRKLLESESEPLGKKIFQIAPYFDQYAINTAATKDRIVFFGAMSRVENISAVDWFLEHVWKHLNERLNGAVNFYIVGGGLPEHKKDAYAAYSNVVVTGFVADPTKIFSHAVCMVVPLLLGAGIKIKVLDAMSSGIPIVTNDIGIEGIPTVAGRDYLHAENAGEFVINIEQLVADRSLQLKLGANGRQAVLEHFTFVADADRYYHHLLQLSNKSYRALNVAGPTLHSV